MNDYLALLPDASAQWASCLWRATWQGSLGLAVVWLICRLAPTMPARYQCWLWRLALVKFAIVLVWVTPIELPLLPMADVPHDTEGPIAAVSLDDHDFADGSSAEYAPFAESVAPAVSSHPTGIGRTSEKEASALRSRIRQNLDASDSGQSVATSTTVGSVATSAAGASFLSASLTVLVVAWLAGVVWQGTIFFRGLLGVRRMRRACCLVQDEDLTESSHALCKESGLRRPPVLLERQGGGSAFLLGVLRPAIVVPSELRTLLGPEELRMALAHELAHVKRRDLTWSAIAAMIRVLFFFHPLVWWASRRLELAQEIAADQLASRRFPDDLARYAKVLLTVVNQPQPSSLLPGLAAGAASHYQTLRRRIVAMKSFHQTPYRVVIVSAVLVIVVAGLGIVPWRLVAAEAADPAADKPPTQKGPAKLSPEQEKILQALQKPIQFEFIETPLQDVVDYVKDVSKIDLRLDEQALREVRIGGDTPVTLDVSGGNLNNSLWLLFHELGLTHVMRGDDLLITTPQEAERIVLRGGINPDQLELWSGNGKVVRTLIYPTLLEFIETPLLDVIDYLEDLHKTPIQLDERALRDVAARPDTPVTCSIRGVTLNSGLRLMLDEIGLTHVVSHAVLLITTPQERDGLVQRGAFEPDDLRFSPGNKQVLSALAENTKFEFIQVPLQDAVDHLEDLHDVRIWLDRRAIRKAGQTIEMPVTGNIQGVTLHGALNTILGKSGLAHVVQHEVLLITTQEESRRRLLSGARMPTDTGTAVNITAKNTVAAALQKPVTVECREKPFHELVDILKQQSGVEIRIDDWGLATAGLKRDFPCTMAVKDAALQSVLNKFLRGLQLGYIVEDDLLVITGNEISGRRRDGSLDAVEYNLKRMGAIVGYGTDSSDRYIAGVRFYVDPGHVTDDVFKDLKTLSRLQRLDLSRTRVTDAGIVHLTNFPELTELDLNTTITDSGLAHVAALKDLRSLNLEFTRVTDDGLKHIRGLMELRELYLSHTNVSDAGLRHLANLKQLEVLELIQTKVTGPAWNTSRDIRSCGGWSSSVPQCPARGSRTSRIARGWRYCTSMGPA